MKSFRLRASCWFASALFVLTLLVLAAFTAHTCNDLRHSVKVDLKHIGRGIERRLADWDGDPGLVPDRIFQAIDDSVLFADDSGEMTYGVYTITGRLLHKSKNFKADIKRFPSDRTRPYHLIWRFNTSEDWHFTMCYNTANHVLLISDWRHVELLESLFMTFLASTLIVLILALYFGFLLGGKITRPLRDIADAVIQLQKGELNVRIQDAEGHDEIAQLKQTLNITFAALEESFNRITQFSSDAAHELKTPLTALRGNVEVCLSRERYPEDYQQTLALCLDEITGMNAIIDDLLLLARPEDTHWEESFSEQNLSSIVDELTQNLAILAQDQGIDFKTSITANIHACGIETFLRRMTNNLISNALKFTPSGGNVKTSLTQEDNAAILTVTDTGIGIAADLHDKIFERMYQVDSSRSRGAGLGLSMVKWIVNLHHGTISVNSEPGKGSTFTVRLPTVRSSDIHD